MAEVPAEHGPDGPLPQALERLRSRPALARSLARLLADDFLSRPAASYIEPKRVAARAVAGVRAMVAAPDDADPGAAPFETWLQEQLETRRARLPGSARSLADDLPPDLPKVLRDAAGRPFTPAPEIVRAVVDHGATRDLMRTILRRSLLDFGKRLWSAVPDARRLPIPGARIGTRLFKAATKAATGAAKGVASAVGADLEAQLEDRVQRFIDSTLDRVIDTIVNRASDPRNAELAAAQRADIVGSVLQLESALLCRERDKRDAGELAADARAVVESFAAWGALEETLTRALAEEAASLGETTVGELLAGSGLEQAWRPHVEEELARHLHELFKTDGFATWLEQLTGARDPEDI